MLIWSWCFACTVSKYCGTLMLPDSTPLMQELGKKEGMAAHGLNTLQAQESPAVGQLAPRSSITCSTPSSVRVHIQPINQSLAHAHKSPTVSLDVSPTNPTVSFRSKREGTKPGTSTVVVPHLSWPFFVETRSGGEDDDNA